MSGPLRVLLIEDNDDDAILVERELAENAAHPPTLTRITSREELETMLDHEWDVVVCDYSLPSFSAPEAIEIILERNRDLPIIVVSGAIGEEQSASLIRIGARDFVMKSHLSRLTPAIEQSLRELAAGRFTRRAEKAYANIVEHSLQALFVLQDGRIVFANRTAIELTDRSIAELLSMSQEDVLDIVKEPDREMARQKVMALILGDTHQDRFTCRIASLDRGTRIVEFYASKIEFDGLPAAHLAAIDITDRTHLEDALKRGKKEWERTFDAVREFVVITDQNHRIIRLNRALATRLNMQERDIVGRSWDQVSGIPGDRWLITRTDGSAVREIEVASEPLGGLFHFSSTPRVNSEGQLIGAIHVGRDVTAQRQAEEVSRRQLSIDQTDQIFRTFRHELGNALNTLKTTLAVYKKNFDVFDQEKREIYLQRCLDALRLAEKLLYAVRTYQTLDEVRLEPIEIGAFIDQESGLLLERPRSRGITCRVVSCSESMPVLADRDALLRVMLNLIDNATSACDGIDEPSIEIGCDLRHGDVIVTIHDNGCGISFEHTDHVFSPFVTTKDDGSGMGLAIVQKLMVRMNGIARVVQHDLPGTAIDLQFPLAPVE